jgi:hypothetical protein
MDNFPIKITKAQITSLEVGSLFINWEITNIPVDPYDYAFVIYRSESPEGPWDRISGDLVDVYEFVDRAVPVGNSNRSIYYSIHIVSKADNKEAVFGPYSQSAPPDLYAREMRRRLHLELREFSGRKIWIFPIRTFGFRCPICWSDTLQKRTKSHCASCFNTGFLHGYMRPIEVWAKISPTQKANTHTADKAEAQVHNLNLLMPHYPSIKPGDLIIEAENHRWRVVNVSHTEKARAVIHQQATIHRIPDTDIEYTIPIHSDKALKDIWFSPVKNFKNHHSLEQYDKDVFPHVYSEFVKRYGG